MSEVENSFPGERLGLAETGPGSVARPGRRLLALMLDWLGATVIAMAFFQYDPWTLANEAGLSQFAPLLVFVVIQILFIPTLGASPGHRIFGMRLVMLNGGWVGLWRPIVRSLLLALVIPAVIFDSDQRGLHDRAIGTLLIRA